MTRRKSRPLLPHEIYANLRPCSQAVTESASSSLNVDDSSQSKNSSSQDSMLESQTSAGSSEDLALPVSCQPSLDSQGTEKEGPLQLGGHQQGTEAEKQDQASLSKAGACDIARCGTLFRSLSQSLPRKERVGSGSNRHSVSFLIHDENGDQKSSAISPYTDVNMPRPVNNGKSIHATPSLRRSSSLMRLSMSLEGKALVTTGTGTTPSPPRVQQLRDRYSAPRPSAGLQRSRSAIETGRNTGLGMDAFSLPKHPAVGRSRDARTWEFYCDKDARDALNEQAEREESGSATAAIALIKTNNDNAKALLASANPRTTHGQNEGATKKLQVSEKEKPKPKLARSKSLMANLQSTKATVRIDGTDKKKTIRRHGSQSAIFEIYADDSDKENWLPGTQKSNPLRRRPAGFVPSKRILEENSQTSNSPGSFARGDSRRARKRASLVVAAGTESRENSSPTMETDVADFQGHQGISREADDLDCVQNLLSLSQGAWR